MEKKVVSSLSSRWNSVVPIILALVSTFIVSNSTFAAQVTLAWNPSPDVNVTGYNVYYGTASRSYTNKIDVGSSTNATITGLVEGTTYYFAATAYNVLGIESDYSGEVSYTVPVTTPPGNQAPTLNAINNVTVNEEAGLQTVNLAGITSGSATENQTLSVTATSSDTSLIPNPTVNYTSANTTGSLSFTPVANNSGVATITVTVNDGQATNNLFSRTFTVTVTGVNDRPTLNALNNVTINEDAGLQTVNLTGISSGAANENQTLVVTASSSNTGLIPTPTVNYTSPSSSGTLTFTPGTNWTGTSTITVTVNDGALTTNRTFTVTVNAINDPPTLNALNNLTINAGSGQQTVSLTGISSGAPNESQALGITASSSNPGVIPTPTVSYTSPNTTGSILFTPVANANGTSTITVTVTDGQATTNRTFTVTVNGLPTITAIPDQVIATNETAGPIAFGISDSETPASALTVSAVSSLPSLIPTSNILFTGANNNRAITLTPLANQSGVATITVQVSDGSTTNSTTFKLTVLGAPGAPTGLQLIANGAGAIMSDTSPSKMKNGKTYSVTAVPAEGQEFVGWSGDVNSSSPKISFVMSSNLVLQANFIPSPFTPFLGSYSGLFHETDEVRVGHSGSFAVKINKHGVYSGSVRFGATKYAFSGKLGFDNTTTNILKSKTGGTLTLNMQVGTNGQPEIFGQLTDGIWTAVLQGDRSTFSTVANPSPFAGNYTLAIPGQSGDPSVPAGHGYGTVKVSASGAVKFAGALADGTKVLQTARLSDNGKWPVFIPLYKGTGQAMSWIDFTNRVTDDLNGNVNWIKPASALAKFYPAGFNQDSSAIGSIYVPPAIGANILNLTSGQVQFADGNISDFTNLITLGANSKVSNASSNSLSMKFSLKAGTFSGKVVDPLTGQSRSFGGAVLEKLNSGYGFMLGTNQSSQVVFAP